MSQNAFNVTALQPCPRCIITPYEELYIAACGSSGEQLQVKSTSPANCHAHMHKQLQFTFRDLLHIVHTTINFATIKLHLIPYKAINLYG